MAELPLNPAARIGPDPTRLGCPRLLERTHGGGIVSAHNAIANHAIRDLHAAATVRAAIRHIRGKFEPFALTREKRGPRHALIRDALESHARNAAMFARVIGGRS